MILTRLESTFNESEKLLFKSMLSIIDSSEITGDSSNYSYGTNEFEFIWQWMIDETYGVSYQEKTKYYPGAHWVIDGRRIQNKHSLEPDTVFRLNDDFFILDAKYYKFGVTRNPKDLPQTDSIQKQITYGEYVDCVYKEPESLKTIYNAFVIPFNSDEWNSDNCQLVYIGEACSDWKNGSESYEHICGIMLDTKYLMQSIWGDRMSKNELSNIIKSNTFW